MPLQENIATYQYFISHADALDLGYICLLRYVPERDPKIDGMAVISPHRNPFPLDLCFLRELPRYAARCCEDVPPIHQEIAFLP